jgi:hypothetical protein
MVWSQPYPLRMLPCKSFKSEATARDLSLIGFFGRSFPGIAHLFLFSSRSLAVGPAVMDGEIINPFPRTSQTLKQ